MKGLTKISLVLCLFSIFIQHLEALCHVKGWGGWSGCSSRCGRGKQHRTRSFWGICWGRPKTREDRDCGQHNGGCQQICYGHGQCRCRPGYRTHGRSCIDINECQSNPCGSNGQCVNHVNRYTCNCNRGYRFREGKCVEINECQNNPCGSNGKCVDHVNRYDCKCNPGYKSNGQTCIEIDECEGNPCGSKGKCVDRVNGYTCTCQPGHQSNGKTCVEVNECQSNPCGNNGDCVDHINSYICNCKPGYRSNNKTCVEIDECQSNPCGANGKCVDHVNGYTCQCRPGYKSDGQTCNEIDECQGNPCGSHGQCGDQVNAYYCTCQPGYRNNGKTCIKVNLCKGNPCGKWGKCVDHGANYTCRCNDGFAGQKCNKIKGCPEFFLKKGCYKKAGDRDGNLLNDYLFNDRSNVRWGKDPDDGVFKSYLAGLTCRCAIKARRKGYVLFGIQFWGECWSAEQSMAAISAKLKNSTDCASPSYTTCSVDDRICAGKDHTTVVYHLQ